MFPLTHAWSNISLHTCYKETMSSVWLTHKIWLTIRHILIKHYDNKILKKIIWKLSAQMLTEPLAKEKIAKIKMEF